MRFLRELRGPGEEADFIRPVSDFDGKQTVSRILAHYNAEHIFITIYTLTRGNCYDPRGNIIRLSHRVFYRKSLLSVALAAHEAAHALQHRSRYSPFMIRLWLLPFAKMSAFGFAILLIWSLIARHPSLTALAIAGFAILALFHSLTILIEINASNQAEIDLFYFGIISETERPIVHRLLRRAAWTYVFAFLLAPVNLFRILFTRESR